MGPALVVGGVGVVEPLWEDVVPDGAEGPGGGLLGGRLERDALERVKPRPRFALGIGDPDARVRLELQAERSAAARDRDRVAGVGLDPDRVAGASRGDVDEPEPGSMSNLYSSQTFILGTGSWSEFDTWSPMREK